MFQRVLVLCVALAVHIVCSTAWAIDSFRKIAQTRPETLDLSRKISSSGGGFTATYSVDHDNAPLNTIHTWTVTLTKRDGSPLSSATIELSADMPEHLHGMHTKPQVFASNTDGQYIVKGMNFHMPGWWEVLLDVSYGQYRDLVYFNILVGED